MVRVERAKIKVSLLQIMKVHGVVEARDHIFAAVELGRDKITRPTLSRILILQEAECAPGPVWERRSEKTVPSARRHDRTQAIQPRAKRLATWDTWSTTGITIFINKKNH